MVPSLRPEREPVLGSGTVAASRGRRGDVVGLDRAQSNRSSARRGTARTDDEVLAKIRVPVTRGHVRTAAVLLAITGLTVGTAPAPAVRHIGVSLLGVAAELALYEHWQITRTSPMTA